MPPRRSTRFAEPLSSTALSPSTEGYSPSPSPSPQPSSPPTGSTVLSSLITGNTTSAAPSPTNGHGPSASSSHPSHPSIILPSALPLPPSVSAPSTSTTSSSSSHPHGLLLTPPSSFSLSPTSPSLRALWLQAKSEASEGRAYWTDEQYVEDITVSFLYQPHTLLALSCLVLSMVYVAFFRINDEKSLVESLRVGCSVAAVFVVILGLLVFPSGPFVRPHPLLWRLAFSVAVLYEVVLIVLLYLNKANARAALTFFYPYLNQPLKERAYADNCAFTYDNLYAGFVDPYALSHFVGWVVKSLILRDNLLCWVISIQWELLEITFTHWLPNFKECWWDQWLLDVLICNGLGIHVGHLLCNYLEMKEYNWRGFMRIPSWSGRLHRAMLQFTPHTWQKVRWEKTKNLRMFFFLQLLVALFHLEEMNAFFLKHLLWIPPPCPLNVIRLGIWGFVGVPALRQVYTFMTDPTCKRIGTQTFLVIVLLITELLIIIKMSPGEFEGKRMEPGVKRMVAACFLAWLLFNVYYVRRIYKQEKRVFFQEGESLRQRAQEENELTASKEQQVGTKVD